MTHKYCRTCDRVKPKTNFSRDSSTPDGLQRTCKDCAKTRAKQYRTEQRAGRGQ